MAKTKFDIGDWVTGESLNEPMMIYELYSVEVGSGHYWEIQKWAKLVNSDGTKFEKIRTYKLKRAEEPKQDKSIMKPFDIKLAEEGHKVLTADGRAARIICWDRENDSFPLVALINECFTHFYDKNGMSFDGKHELDLVMAPTKKEGWINIYRDKDFPSLREYKGIFHSEADAKSVIEEDDNYICTKKIEWEE